MQTRGNRIDYLALNDGPEDTALIHVFMVGIAKLKFSKYFGVSNPSIRYLKDLLLGWSALGLTIYNSTTLDVDLPSFAFKKLLADAQHATGPALINPSRPRFKCTLDDFAECRPALAKGLRMLLDYDGDVAEIFCYDFVVQLDRYEEVENVPLCLGGESRPVTNSNRRKFVDLYVRYFLEKSATRQFEPLKRGFFTVCGGNALSLFRPEEIEL